MLFKYYLVISSMIWHRANPHRIVAEQDPDTGKMDSLVYSITISRRDGSAAWFVWRRRNGPSSLLFWNMHFSQKTPCSPC